MTEAFICDAVRTPIGRYGGALAPVRADDLAAIPIKALIERNPGRRLGRARRRHLRLRQPGGRGQPQRRAHGAACWRACPTVGAGRHASTACAARGWTRSAMAARAIAAGEADLIIAGGVGEHDAARPSSCPRRRAPSRRNAEIYDTTIGWRFVNPKMKSDYGVDSDARDRRRTSPQEYQIIRAPTRTPSRCAARQSAGRGAGERPLRRGDRRGRRSRSARAIGRRRHATSIRAPTPRSKSSPSCEPIVRADGTVTAGNASGVNDGACRDDRRLRGGGEAPRPDAARPRPRRGHRRASRRASWASARRPRRRSCWRGSA